MGELDQEKNFSAEIPDKPGHSTGPRSPEGKARSSMNRLTHGCRSETLVLPGEDAAELEFILESWTHAYNPQDPTTGTLVYETAKAHWFFLRNQKRLHQIEIRLPADAWHWTPDNIQLYNNFLRYKTAAERSFYRAFHALEAHLKRSSDRAAQAEKARAQMAQIEIEWIKKQQEEGVLSKVTAQCIQVVATGCGTATNWTPSNQQILETAAETGKTPEFMSRYLLFVNGVPPEYDWSNPNHIQRTERTLGIQRLRYSDWLEQIEKEKAAGRILPRYTALAAFFEP